MIIINKSILRFNKISKNNYHTIIKNNHGRKLYLSISRSNEAITICNCFYIDRTTKTGNNAIPKKWKTLYCNRDTLLEVLATELDKRFYDIEFCEKENNLSAKEYINIYLQNQNKYKFLILIESNNILKTRLKNCLHRTIYIEIKKDGNRGLIQTCNYCDRHYKRSNKLVTPPGLSTIYFDYNIEKVLEIINSELNCDFTNVIITSDTFDFNKANIPICGSI